MIEPFESDCICTSCGVTKPQSGFSVRTYRSDLRPLYYRTCKSCRAFRARKTHKPGSMGDTSAGAWKWPRDDRSRDEKGLDGLLAVWRYPVVPGQLRSVA